MFFEHSTEIQTKYINKDLGFVSEFFYIFFSPCRWTTALLCEALSRLLTT